MRYTVLGSSGFIGRHLVMHLQSLGHDVLTPARDIADIAGQSLGHVIYAIGLTGNFRQKPAETIEAHVTTLQRLMQGADFTSWLYLSSTRVYGGLAAGEVATEDTKLSVVPGMDGLYDLSKLLGEAFCAAQDNPRVRTVRLSNVYGAEQSPHTFLGAVMQDLAAKGSVDIGEAPSSAKDYIAIDDVVTMLPQIAEKGQHRLYNLASGRNTSHQEVANLLTETGYKVTFREGGVKRIFPPIDVARIKHEFQYAPRHLTDDLPLLLKAFENLYGFAKTGEIKQ
jgi:nucleoside-diphosphate-sugar epimerase